MELLYIKYKQLMFRVANCIPKNEGLGEDVVQQVFLKVLENFDKVGETPVKDDVLRDAAIKANMCDLDFLWGDHKENTNPQKSLNEG